MPRASLASAQVIEPYQMFPHETGVNSMHQKKRSLIVHVKEWHVRFTLWEACGVD